MEEKKNNNDEEKKKEQEKIFRENVKKTMEILNRKEKEERDER